MKTGNLKHIQIMCSQNRPLLSQNDQCIGKCCPAFILCPNDFSVFRAQDTLDYTVLSIVKEQMFSCLRVLHIILLFFQSSYIHCHRHFCRQQMSFEILPLENSISISLSFCLFFVFFYSFKKFPPYYFDDGNL